MLLRTRSTRTSNRLAPSAAGLILLAEFGQVLASTHAPALIVPYGLLHAGFAGIFFFQWLCPADGVWVHASLAAQAALVSAILLLNPEIGTVSALFVLLAWLAARALSGRTLWIWLAVFGALITLPFMIFLGPLIGLARALMPVAGCFILASYISVHRGLEADQRARLRLLEELEQTHQQLRHYAAQAGDVVASEERERLARALRQTVQPMLERIATTTATLRVDLDRDDATPAPALHELQTLTRSALTEMRRLITLLRPDSAPTA